MRRIVFYALKQGDETKINGGYNFIFVLIFCVLAFGSVKKEFVFTSGASTDKIILPNEFIKSGLLKINCDCEIPNWRFIEENNTIYFSENILPNRKYVVEYEIEYPGISKTYELNIPKYHAENFAENGYDNNSRGENADGGNIVFEGVKSIGVMLGSNGEAAINQALDVKIYGDIDSLTTISAHINDQSSSLDGQTSEIGELDKIYITVENPKWTVTAGDLEIRSAESGVLREFYTPKGLFAETRNGEIGRKNNAFVGITAAKDGYAKFIGIAGIQNGMFNLRPGKNSIFVQIILGSVSVSIDGRLLKENENYVVDYDLAAIRFSANTPITDGQTVEVRYKYRNYDYNTFSAGTQHEFSLFDSTLNVNISGFYDKDVFSSSQREFSADEISQMKSGKKPQVLLGNKIHKNDVLKAQAFNRIYSLDSSSNVYRWEGNPEAVYLQKDLYSVNFQPSDSGDYAPYSPDMRAKFLTYSKEYLDSVENATSFALEPIYLFTGKNEGSHTAFGETVLPKQNARAQISALYSPSEQIKIGITAAGASIDENTLSTQKNKYDNSSALKTDMFVSSNQENIFAVKDKFEAQVAGDAFVNDVSDAYVLDYRWAIPDSASKYSFWENIFYAGLPKYFFLKGGYGRAALNSAHSPHSRRISGGFEAGSVLPLDFDYLFTQRILQDSDGRQQRFAAAFNSDKIALDLNLEENWYKENGAYLGDFTSQVSLKNPDATLGGLIQYKRRDSSPDDKHFSAKNDFWHVLISTSADKKISPLQQIKADASVILRKGSFETLTSITHGINSQDLTRGINTKWDLGYETQSEQRFEYVKVPTGTGTHIKDTISGLFVEREFGDYVIKEVFVYEKPSDGVQKSAVSNDFSISWHNNFKSVKLSGNFYAESKMPKDGGGWYEFLPVVANLNEKMQKNVSYSAIAYSQYLSILPQNAPQLSANVRLTASKSVELGNIRNGFDVEDDFSYKFDKFILGFSNRGFTEKRTDLVNYNFSVRDINVKPIETIILREFMHVFVEETFGLTAKDSVSGRYFAVRPGIRFLPKNYGSAEISYTYALVRFDGDLLYNMADGFAKNGNHRIQSIIGIKANEKIRFAGFLRADKNAVVENKWRLSASINAEIAIK